MKKKSPISVQERERNKENIIHRHTRKKSVSRELFKKGWIRDHCNDCWFKKNAGGSWDFNTCYYLCIDKKEHNTRNI